MLVDTLDKMKQNDPSFQVERFLTSTPERDAAPSQEMSLQELVLYHFLLTFINDRAAFANKRKDNCQEHSTITGYCMDAGINAIVLDAPFWAHCPMELNRCVLSYSYMDNLLIVKLPCVTRYVVQIIDFYLPQGPPMDELFHVPVQIRRGREKI
jgi:hypothetical protein